MLSGSVFSVTLGRRGSGFSSFASFSWGCSGPSSRSLELLALEKGPGRVDEAAVLRGLSLRSLPPVLRLGTQEEEEE